MNDLEVCQESDFLAPDRIRDAVRTSLFRGYEESLRTRASRPSHIDSGPIGPMLQDLRVLTSQVGGQPPCPPTLRGKVGALAVRLVRRAAFSLISQVGAAHELTCQVLEEYSAELDRMSEKQAELLRELKSLRERVAQLEGPAGRAAVSEKSLDAPSQV